jgi:hypothetical protein
MRNKLNLHNVLGFVLVTILIVSALVPAIVPLSSSIVKASPEASITLSPTSGRGPLGDATLGIVSPATVVTVTGTGFPPNQDNIVLRIAPSNVPITPTAGIELTLTRVSIAGSTTGVRADASGCWKATFSVPALQAGTYNVFAVYTPAGGSPVTSAPATFTVVADMLVLEEATLTSTGVYNSRVHILLTGFQGGETVNIIPTNFLVTAPDGTTSFTSFTVSTSGDTIGQSNNVGYVSGARPGGTFTVVVYGASSGISVSKTFTVNPTIAIDRDNDNMLEPQVSISRTASTFYIWGRNWPVTTPAIQIPANNLTIIDTTGRAYSTSHSSIIVGADGSFGPVAVTYFDDLPTQPLSIKLYGTIFSLANRNIIPPATLRDAQYNARLPLAGALVASDPARPEVTYLSTTTVRHSAGAPIDAVYVYAINGPSAGTWGVNWDGSAATVSGLTTLDDCGAGLVIITGIPSGSARRFGPHTLTFTGDMSAAGAQTINVLPYVSALGIRGYRETFTISGYGFVPSEAITVSIAGTPWFTIPAASVGSDGSFSITSDPLPALAIGGYDVTFAGSTSGNTYTTSITIRPVVIRDPAITPSEPLTTNLAGVGDPVVLRSSVTIGVFGLKANTLYKVVIGGVEVASFTSTATGTIPGAVSFRVPQLRAGLYYVDIVEAETGASAIFGLTRYTGDQYQARVPPAYGNPGAGLRLTVTLRLTAFPTAGPVGTEVTLSGSGLTPNTRYFVTISNSPTTLAGPYAGYTLATFTSTAAGEIPEGVSITIPDLPNDVEAGTTWYIHVSTAGQLASLSSSGFATFVCYAYATISPVQGSPGSRVDIVVTGLTGGRLYQIYFGFVDAEHPGMVVGSLVANALGKASAFFTVPSVATGNYRIQLYDPIDDQYVLNILPTFSVVPPVPPVLPGTATLTPSAPTLLDSAGRPTTSVPAGMPFYVQVNVTSNVGVDLSVYVIAQVKDATGKVVALGLTAADVKAGATKAIPVAFLGITAPGRYTVTVYVWSSIAEPTPLALPTTFAITIT